MPLTIGARLGPYEILSALGAGGMGEVYRARDGKLGRDVALKVLPDLWASDPDRIARFQREAQLLASLNHPNIGAIHDLEDVDGTRFLVLELVEGETLADAIARGPLPVDECLRIAAQIADALEAAHEKGLVHRDLKPANIKITPESKVKVLDFGLAKAMEPAGALSSNLSQSPTITSPAMTQVGVILGTAAYMAPEQARGKPVDKRADIWAFGAVLYEMLTGQRAFGGEDVTVTLARVVEREPDLTLLPATTPARVRQALRVCLQKDLKQRGGDMAAIRLALEGVFETPAPQTSEPVALRRPLWQRAAPFAAVGAIVAGLAVVASRPEPLPEVMRFQIYAPAGSSLPLGTPAISPDGRTIAYTVNDPDGARRIHVRPLDRVESRALPGTEEALHPFWSPDGRSLAFLTQPGRELMRIDVEAGKPRALASDVNAPWHGTWNETGDILFMAPGGVVSRLSSEGGTATPAGSLDEERGESRLDFPFFLTDGRRFLVRVVSNGVSSIQLATLGSTARTMVIDQVASAPILAPTPGGKTYLLFMRARELMAQEFDDASGTVRGTPVVLVSDIGQVANPLYRPTVGVSPSGILAFQSGGASSSGQLVWVDRSGKETGTLPPDVSFLRPQLAPDGSFVVGHRPDESGTFDIWITDLRRASATRVTFGSDNDRDAVWSPDGKRLAFRRLDGQPGIYIIEADGSQPEQRLIDGGGSVTAWSPDARYLLGTQSSDLMLSAVDGGAAPIAIGSRGRRVTGGQFSPDGRYIAFTSDESGRDEVYVQAMPPGKARQKVSINGGSDPRWRRDGKELFFISPGSAMMSADIDLAETPSVGLPRELFRNPSLSLVSGYDVRADGNQFLIAGLGSAAIAGLGSAATDAPITVVVNWWVELE